MFFLHDLEHIVTLHPSFLGPRVRDYIERQLINDLEGTFNGKYLIVCILNSMDISEGRVVPSTSQSEFLVHYRAVVWKPFKGEIIDGRVQGVVDSGFFVEIGPLSVFVSKALIGTNMKFDGNATPPQWTDGADQIIEKGTSVRLKIKGVRGELDKMYAIATIKEDYLGQLP